MKLIIGITGSTGVIYGIRMLETLKKLNVETHLVMSEWGEKCISMETDYTIEYVKSLLQIFLMKKIWLQVFLVELIELMV